MKKQAQILIICLASWVGLSAQNDSLEQSILNYENKQTSLIANGRSMLLDSLMAGRTEQVATLQHYLETQVENESYMVFYQFEKWLLDLWTAKYFKVLPLFKNLTDENLPFKNNYYSIPPPHDLLTEKLVEKVGADKSMLFEKLDETNLSAPDKEFLKLLTDWLLFVRGDALVTTSFLNQATNAYLTKYPQGEYAYFVGRIINQEETLAKRGMSFEFFSGYGGYSGGLKSNFGHHVPIGVAFDFFYKKWIFGFRDHIGIGKTDKDIAFKTGVWPDRSKFNHIIIELSAGHYVFDSEKLMVFPFAGVHFADISPPENDGNKKKGYDKFGTGFKTAPVAGINFDFKLNSPYSENPQLRDGYLILRLRGGFSPINFEKKLTGLDGYSYYITLGFGGVMRKVVKRYRYQY